MFGNFTEHEAEVWSRAQEYGWERKIRRGNNRHYCPKCIQALADMDEVFKQDMNKG